MCKSSKNLVLGPIDLLSYLGHAFVLFQIILSSKIPYAYTVKLGNKERLNKEHLGNSEPFLVTNMPVYFINSEQIGISEKFCDGKKDLYYQVRLL